MCDQNWKRGYDGEEKRNGEQAEVRFIYRTSDTFDSQIYILFTCDAMAGHFLQARASATWNKLKNLKF